MQVTEIKNPVFPARQTTNRSTNRLHVSEIYSDLENELFPPRNTNNRYFAEVGFLFEDALSNAFAERLADRIGEVELDNIVCSPDGVDWNSWILEEYKCTWKSSKLHPRDHWRWMVQIKSYCKVLHMNQAKMRILYLNGNYRGSGPQYKEFMFTFTQDEIDINWQMLLNHAKRKGML